MYLKRVELQGFKSFADKTEIEFDKNITSIVGPNGSGKSNIADAIRWVLGEQSMKNLRGSKLEDIIFSGTSARKKMGFAEVSLVLDNTQKLINLDYTEITVSRRIFRNGNSEYYINMVPCRLKDIHEMFYDTGVGRTGYSIVGQGKIDEIISSRSEDRREVFEEASGIIKYKIRKQESERKLESTEQNLVRIKDIVSELELQLEPLSIQADKARKFLSFRDEMKTSEINLYVHNINKLSDRSKKLDQELLDKDEMVQARRKELNDLIEKEKMRFEAIKEIDQKIKNSNDEYHGLRSEIDKINADIMLIEEKKNNTNDNIERYRSDIEKLNTDKTSLLTDLEKKKSRIDDLEKQQLEFNETLQGYEAEYEKLINILGSEESELDQLKDKIMDLMDTLSDKKNQYSNAKMYILSMEKRKEEIKSESLSSVSEKDILSTQKNDINNKLNKIENEIKKLNENLDISNEKYEEKKKQIEEKEKSNTKTLETINYSRARLNALKTMEDNLEGYNRSVKEIIKKVDLDKEFAIGIHGPLAKLIEVPKNYSLPIEISLGAVLQNIVTDNESSAKKAIGFLKQNDIGRATFLPITSIKPSYMNENSKNMIKSQKGFLAIASEVVTADPRYKDIIDNFLSRTIIVDDLDNAIMIAKVTKNEFRIVTLEGDLINRGGAITGGSLKGISSNLLTRTSEIDELKKIIDKTNKIYESNRSEIETAKSELQKLIATMKLLEEETNEKRIMFVKEQGELKQVLDKTERITSRISYLEGEILQIDKEINKNKSELEMYENELKVIEKQITDTKNNVESRTGQHKTKQTEKDILHQDITDYKISVNSITESINNLRTNLDDIEKENLDIDTEITKINDMISRGNKFIQQNKDTIDDFKKELLNTNQKLIGKEANIDRLTQDKEDLDESIQKTYDQKLSIEDDIEKTKDDKNKIEIRKVKCEAEIDTIKNRLWDEYELTFTNCEKTASPLENAQKTLTEIERLKSEIKELGDVNVNSIDDYVKTKERYEFLNIQHDDMIKAGDDLRKVIKEMEVIMKKQFLEQFRKINELFNQVFKDLFLGGTASITLVDESDILQSPIEINVQPPGKKLQNMMLLSGGEKAFTAIALLFAIIKLKDTPFCILDEIDAALDDPNVVRFSDYIRELTQRTQFILVTHRKGTMECSDVLYGVTAQEKGVSKIVSLNMRS